MRLVLSGCTSTITHRNTAISASAKTAWRREGAGAGGRGRRRGRGRGRGGAGEGQGKRQRRRKSGEERETRRVIEEEYSE